MSQAELFSESDRHGLERAYYDSARLVLETRVRERPGADLLHSQLGVAYAALGRRDAAVQEGKRAVELLPVSKDAFLGPNRVELLAWIYVLVGDYDSAMDELEFLLSVPSDISIPLLRVES